MKCKLWDDQKREWHTGRDFLIDLNGDVLFNLGYGGLSKCEYNCRDQHVCEFSGILDKNGKEIYKNDLVRERYEKCSERGEFEDYAVDRIVKVIFEDGCFLLQITPHVKEKIISSRCEVVGNIFESPLV